MHVALLPFERKRENNELSLPVLVLSSSSRDGSSKLLQFIAVSRLDRDQLNDTYDCAQQRSMQYDSSKFVMEYDLNAGDGEVADG